MRFALRKLDVDLDKVPVVFSTERPAAKLQDLHEGATTDNAHEYQLLPSFRVRIMPVVGMLPAMFGNAAAAFVATCIAKAEEKKANNDNNNVVVDRNSSVHSVLSSMLTEKSPSKREAERIRNALYQSEERLYKTARDARTLSATDCMFVMFDVFDGRCCVSGVVEDLELRRFDRNQPVSITNVICLSSSVARKFDAGKEVLSEEQRQKVQRKLDDLKRSMQEVEEGWKKK